MKRKGWRCAHRSESAPNTHYAPTRAALLQIRETHGVSFVSDDSIPLTIKTLWMVTAWQGTGKVD